MMLAMPTIQQCFRDYTVKLIQEAKDELAKESDQERQVNLKYRLYALRCALLEIMWSENNVKTNKNFHHDNRRVPGLRK